MSLLLARRAVKTARTHVIDATTARNRELMRALGAQLEAVERALIDAIYSARQDAAVAMYARHTDACISAMTDPGATCVCRPPVVAEPLVGLPEVK